MKVDPKLILEIERLFNQWVEEVSESDLRDNTKTTYILHPSNFVKWCKGNFSIRGYNKGKIIW